MRAAAFLAAFALTLATGLAAQAAGTALKLDAATERRLGVAVAPLKAERRSASVAGFARGLDAVPLASLDADVAAAAAALAASQAEAVRARALNAADETISKRAAEAAVAQARADAARLTLLRRRLGLEWGPGVAKLSDAQRGRLVADLAAGRAGLVRLDLPAQAAPSRGSASLDLGPAGHATAAVLGVARGGDPRLQTPGLLAVVRGSQALQIGVGTVVPATLGAGAAAEGVVLPRGALLRNGGRTYAYVRLGPGQFERRAVNAGLSDPAGLFVSAGFRPGEAVVTAGAAQLFAAETPAKPAD